jgi:hypothetical protein
MAHFLAVRPWDEGVEDAGSGFPIDAAEFQFDVFALPGFFAEMPVPPVVESFEVFGSRVPYWVNVQNRANFRVGREMLDPCVELVGY